jgi:hypothetical protein
MTKGADIAISIGMDIIGFGFKEWEQDVTPAPFVVYISAVLIRGLPIPFILAVTLRT